jgi:hypothetical protein
MTPKGSVISRSAAPAQQGRLPDQKECQAALNDALAALRIETFMESSI